jgi:hydroxymethylpyrimidine pyrophosphatase-like HAD family hydrolase
MRPAIEEALDRFLSESNFAAAGGIITDLDGTAIHEDHGRIYIPKPVEEGFKELHDLGRPFVLNSLRFPLSVLRTFGRDWYSISNSPIPAVTLNGSLTGYVEMLESGEMSFSEIDAFPLEREAIDRVVDRVGQYVEGGLKDLLLFYYPRDWRVGEVIWTPLPEKVLQVKEKYVSASSVTAVTTEKLRQQLKAEEICMIFLLIDAPEEQLMAYQHAERSSFLSRQGVDKLFGAQQIARRVGFDLSHSIGAGDTEMDRFLAGVGLAVLVGGLPLPFHGAHGTVRLADSGELGDFLFAAAGKVKALAPHAR